MKATDLRDHLAEILERIESWPELWAADLAQYIELSLEASAGRAEGADRARRLRSERTRSVIRLAIADLFLKLPNLDRRGATDILQRQTGASLPVIREELASFFDKVERNERFRTETTSKPFYTGMTSTSFST